MYMRITWGRLKSGCWDDFERIYIDATRARGDVKGLRGHLLARDVADPDAGYTISLWDDEESMLAQESSRERAATEKELEPYFSGEYTIGHCEVRDDTLTAGSKRS